MTISLLFPNNTKPIVFSIMAWYIFSLSISLYNKWMFGPDLGFEFPVIITSLHQLVLFILSGSCLLLTPRFRLSTDTKVSYFMPWQMYVRTILPCALASAADIGSGNSSFRFITLSLYTMVKSSSLVFVLLWGVAFKLETLSTRLVLIVTIMTGGVMMMVYGHESEENDSRSTHIFIGCSLVLVSAIMSGLRWALTQLLLKRHTHTQNPILTIFYLAPAMSLSLFITGGLLEGFSSFAASKVWEVKGVPVTLCLLIIPGILAFLMTLSEFILLSYASLLTLSIAGIFKELLTILLGHLVFGDSLGLINGVGLLITLFDILWYNYYRLTESSTISALTDMELGEVNKRTNSEQNHTDPPSLPYERPSL